MHHTHIKILFAAYIMCLIGYTSSAEAASNLDVTLAADIAPGPASSFPHPLTVFNNRLYLRADNGITGSELWVYNGNTPPEQVFDLNAVHDARPTAAIEFSGKLIFTAVGDTVDENNFEFWEWDGAAAAPVKLTQLGGGMLSSSLPKFTIFNGMLYFQARDGVNGAQIWGYDGDNPPIRLTTINSPTGLQPSGVTTEITVYNNTLYFIANNGTDGNELWQFDGINAPSQSLDINVSGNGFTGNPDFVIYQDLLHFFARDADGRELRSFDGTTLDLVDDLNPGAANARNAFTPGMTVFGNKLYFRANDGSGNGEELWVYNGVSTPTLVEDINPGSTTSSAQNLFVVTTPLTSKLVFIASEGSELKLWSYDEDEGRSEIGPSGIGFVKYNDAVYYGGNTDELGSELLVIADKTPDTSFCDLNAPGAIVGTAGSDWLVGTPGNDIILGLDGNDRIFGLSGDDCIAGGPGNDRIVSGNGDDTIDGGEGNDRIFSGNGMDAIFGSDGDDIIVSGQGSDKIDAGDGNDFVLGGAGNDEIDGGSGIDRLIGGSGVDNCVNGEIVLSCNP